MADANSPHIDEVDIVPNLFNGACPPVMANTVATTGFPNVSDFTAKQLIITPDSKFAIILGDICTTGTVASCSDASQQGVLMYDLASKQASVVSLGGAKPLSGAVTPDGANLYVGASDKNVHRVDLTKTPPTDTPITVNPCPSVTGGCNPDFVVLKPVATVVTLSSIAVTPANPTISTSGNPQNCPPGANPGQVCFTATGTFSDKTTRDMTNFVAWSSSNTNVAVIGPTASGITPVITTPGVAQAKATGTSTITASSGGTSGSTTLTVQ
jgi:hypothetical protein